MGPLQPRAPILSRYRMEEGDYLTNSSTEIVYFSEKLHSVLDRGRVTSTYKYAVLLGLLDVSLEATQRDGAPARVTTHQLAERVPELPYRIAWRTSIRRSEFNGRESDNQIRFLPGSAENLAARNVRLVEVCS